MASLCGRTALITGGGRGIGQAISIALGQAGANIALTYRRDQESASQTIEEIEKMGRTAKAYQIQLQNIDECSDLVTQVIDDCGVPSIYVNNAGIASRGLSVAETSPEEVAQLMSIHAFAAHALCRVLIPKMRAQERGDVVFISSTATQQPIPNGAPYNMSKAALEMLALTIAKEEREHGIRANIVAPGLVDTEMGLRLMRARAGILNLKDLDEVSPFGHVCKPSEVANVVRFLVSSENSYMTGERLTLDAGGTVDQDWY